MSAVVRSIQARALETLLGRMTAAERYILARRLVLEMPKDDRQRLLANSPGFVPFARAFLLAAGRASPRAG